MCVCVCLCVCVCVCVSVCVYVYVYVFAYVRFSAWAVTHTQLLQHGRLKKKTPAALEAARKAKVAARISKYQEIVHGVMGMISRKEQSQDVLNATTAALSLNSDLYTVWNYRRTLLLAQLQPSTDAPTQLEETSVEAIALEETSVEAMALEETSVEAMAQQELEFTASCLRTNPKSYWVWNHRVWVLSLPSYSPDYGHELHLCGLMLEADDRNFHCWNYRRYVVAQAGVSPEDELAYTTDKINANFSNYSAWHYRSALLPKIHGPSFALGESTPAADQEFEKVQAAFYTEPDDQSAWLYHRWLMGRSQAPPRLTALFWAHSSSLVLIFSAPVAGLHPSSVLVSLDGEGDPLELLWEPAHKSRLAGGLSPVWTATLPDSAPSPGDNAGFVVSLPEDGGVYGKNKVPLRTPPAITTPPPSSDAVLSVEEGTDAQDAAAAASAREALLCRELEATEELLDLEPDSKWALVTKAYILSQLGGESHVQTVRDIYLRLLDIDPYRTGYYRDALSALSLKSAVSLATPTDDDDDDDSSAFALETADLTTLSTSHVASALAPLRSLSFAGNPLRSLAGVEVFVAAASLNVSRCSLRSLGAELAHLNLTHLDLSFNSFSSIESAFASIPPHSPLTSSLTSLNLEGCGAGDGDVAFVATLFPNCEVNV